MDSHCQEARDNDKITTSRRTNEILLLTPLQMTSVLNLILSHQPPAAVSNMLTHWNRCVPNESILIAYGGTKSEFDAIQHREKFFIDDPRLRTRDHQREFQSYT